MLKFRPSLQSVQLAFALSLISATYACHSGEGANGAGGAGGGGGSGDAVPGTFLGGWAGTFTAKQAEDGSALRDTPANATFTATDDSSGDFVIELTQVKNASVKGIYHNVADRSLLLEIKESALSTVGVAGSRPKLDFDLIGDSFLLHNDRVDFTFVRPSGEGTGGNTDDKKKDDGAPEDPLYGRWLCTDAVGNSWKVNIRGNGTFAIDVYDTSTARSGVYLDGAYVITRDQDGADADAILTVRDSDSAKYKGMELKASMRGDAMLELRRGAEPMQCDRD